MDPIRPGFKRSANAHLRIPHTEQTTVLEARQITDQTVFNTQQATRQARQAAQQDTLNTRHTTEQEQHAAAQEALNVRHAAEQERLALKQDKLNAKHVTEQANQTGKQNAFDFEEATKRDRFNATQEAERAALQKAQQQANLQLAANIQAEVDGREVKQRGWEREIAVSAVLFVMVVAAAAIWVHHIHHHKTESGRILRAIT